MEAGQAVKPDRAGCHEDEDAGDAGGPARADPGRRRRRGLVPNPVTGKESPGRGYAPATVPNCEGAARLYDSCCETWTGPVVNPFLLARVRRGGQALAQPDGTAARLVRGGAPPGNPSQLAVGWGHHGCVAAIDALPQAPWPTSGGRRTGRSTGRRR